MAIKIGVKKNGPETVGYGRKAVKIEDKYGRMLQKAFRKAISAASRFGSMIK